MMNNDKGVTTNDSIGELVRIVDNHLNPMNTTSNLSWTRTYTPPLMGTSARAVKRRVDGDTGPIRIEGTDTYNRPLQHHYQNVRQILEQPQQSSQISNVDQSNYSRSLSNTKRDFFDKQSQLPISTYDYPPHESQQQQQPMQKIVTTITTTTETLPTLVKQTPLLTNHILEQSTETNIKTIKNDSQQPQIIERTEKYQEFSDSTNDGIRRLPMFPITKTTGATDLDQVQAQVNRLSDDHQAIQQLARELQEHNVTTTNQYKRLASQTNTTLTDTTTTTTTNPSNTIITDKTNKTVTSEFTVIDALLDNPLGSNDDKQNSLLHKRFNDILSNIRNSEYVNLFKNSTAKKILKTPTNEPVNTRLIRKQTHFTESNIEQISMSTEQTPLLNSKEKKKQDKVNKKKSKTKTKSKKLPKNVDYQVIDAIINSPISLYIPDSYLAKYKVTSRLSQLSSVPSIRSTDNSISMSQQLDTKANNETVYNLANVIHEIFLHHAAALTLLGSTPKKQLQNPMKPSVINELVYKQQPQQSLMNSNQSEIQLQPDPNKTRVLYRYLDEHGNVLKLSSTPPSQLRESLAEPSQQSSYRRTEPTYIYNQQITRNDEQNLRRIPEHEQRITRQVESRLPTTKTITKEDLELRNKQTSQLNNYSPRLDQITLEPLAQFSYRNIEPTYISNRQITKDDEQNLRRVPEHEQRITKQDELRWPTAIITTSTTKEDLELRNKNVSKLNIQPSPTVYNIPITIEHPHTIKTPPQQQRKHHHPNQQNVSLSWLPLSYQLEQQYVPIGSINYDTDSSMSEHSPIHQPYDYVPVYTHHHHNRGTFLPNACCHNHLQGHAHYPSPPPVSYVTSCIIPEYSSGSYSRNYIEVFRDGETIPSEVYSLPINELITTNNSHTSYDQHENKHQPSSSINLQFEKNIPSTSTHDQYHSRTIDTSPNRDNIYFDNYLPQSKSFDYRPLRTKIQREHKITPRLLVEEWDNPQQSSSTNYNQQMKFRWHVKKPNQKQNNDTNGHIEPQDWINRHDFIDANQQKPENKIQIRLKFQPIFKALALHSFYAQTSRELSFKKGDILLVLRRINDDWLEGEYQGSIGIFPLNHVELFPIEINKQDDYLNEYEYDYDIEGEAIVKYDFIPQQTFELQLRKGDKVILLRKIDNYWYEGRLNHIEGIFPAAYVETLKEPADIFSKKSHQNERAQISKQNSPDLEEPSVEQISIIPDLSLPPMRKCQVLYDYTPQNPDELEIHVGDIINIIEMCDDGWYCGMMEKSNHDNKMKFGTFPGNYVKLLS